MDKTERLRARASTDPQLRVILRKIADGRADFTDTASYSIRFSQILGDVLSDGILDSPDRVQDCKDLLRLSYDEINSLLTQVQSALDEQAGIHIAPQHEKFPEERVEQVARSLIDPTVSDETVVRRASNAASNVSASFHDDYIRRNAQFRSDLGLRTYIVRISGSESCSWCSEVSGRFRMGTQPEGVFRRHDSCECTILYDGTTLKGQLDEDGKRTKKWEEVAEFASVRPTVLTPEQADEVERNARARFSSLTNRKPSDIIKMGSGKVALENQRYGRNKETLVNKTYIDGGEYRRKYDNATENPEVNKTLYDCAKTALKHRSGTVYEDMYWINGDTGLIVHSVTNSTDERAIAYTDSIKRAINGRDDLITIHTHPSSMPPSASDLNSCYKNNYRAGFVACHNGRVFGYTSNEYVNERIYNMYIQNFIKEGYSEFDAQLMSLEKLSQSLDVKIWEVV